MCVRSKRKKKADQWHEVAFEGVPKMGEKN